MLTCCILKWATTEAVTVRWRVMIAEFYPLSRAEKGTFVLCFRKLTATPATMMNILQTYYIPPVIHRITTEMQMTPRWLRAVVTWIAALQNEDIRYYVAGKTMLNMPVTVETPIGKVQLLASCSLYLIQEPQGFAGWKVASAFSRHHCRLLSVTNHE